jgi:hypothetical protein
MEHHAILHREFDRIAAITDEAFNTLSEDAAEEGQVSKLLEARYKDWAGLLLRYHDAIERISKETGDTAPDLPSMKRGEAQDDLRRRESGSV